MIKKEPKILLIEICNFDDYPTGGYLAFAKQMLTAFGNQLVLVGMTTDNTPVGKWTKKEINGVVYDFFSVRKVKKDSRKPIIPGRLKTYLAVRKYRNKILEKQINNVFIQTPEVLFALPLKKIKNLCTRIPGVENPLSISRYWYGKYFALLFDRLFFKSLKKAKLIFATADIKAITGFRERSKGKISNSQIIQFPTRVNTSIFKPIPKIESRVKLDLPLSKFILVTTGRLTAHKGWKFMIDAFVQIVKSKPKSLLIFIGDGEDKNKIENYITRLSLKDKVLLAGRVSHDNLSVYLNASDVYIMGSYIEGWSTSLVEAIACGIPAVCTNFSSAKELITNDKNGYVIENHNIDAFVDAVFKSRMISKEELGAHVKEMQQYSTTFLKESILNKWKLIENDAD